LNAVSEKIEMNKEINEDKKEENIIGAVEKEE
jgi:hypothetical protein